MKADEASPHLKANGDIKAVHISKPSFLYYTWQLSPWHLEGLLRITASGFHSRQQHQPKDLPESTATQQRATAPCRV